MNSTELTPIDSLELREIRLPLVTPFETNLGVEREKHALLVILRKEGITGYGECVAGIGPWFSEETIASAKYIIQTYLAPILFEQHTTTAPAFIALTEGIRGNNMAVACVEMALWDLLGKMQDTSLSKLLGGKKEEVEVGVAIGLQPSPGKLVETVDGYLRGGYRRIKVKIKPGYDVEYVKAVRKAFPEIKLQVDANSAYTIEDTKHLKMLDEFKLLLVEQPLGHDDVLDHAKLQKKLSTPICLDESIHTPDDARKALEVEACKVINIKPGRVRGFQRSKEIHDLCLKRNVPVWCGGMLETGIGRAFNVALASLPGFTLPGDTSASRRYFKRDIITREFNLTTRSTLPVPHGPGIGVEIDSEALDAVTVSRATRKNETRR
jgi:O-succinylbenzoate synthase